MYICNLIQLKLLEVILIKLNSVTIARSNCNLIELLRLILLTFNLIKITQSNCNEI